MLPEYYGRNSNTNMINFSQLSDEDLAVKESFVFLSSLTSVFGEAFRSVMGSIFIETNFKFTDYFFFWYIPS